MVVEAVSASIAITDCVGVMLQFVLSLLTQARKIIIGVDVVSSCQSPFQQLQQHVTTDKCFIRSSKCNQR